MKTAVVLALLAVLLVANEGKPTKKGCGKPPHSDQCLMNKWAFAGCLPEGSAAPPSGPMTETWRNMEIADVKDGMKKIRRRAVRGWTKDGQEYVTMCYGKSGADCGGPGASAPHTVACLRKLWTDAGCYMIGTGAPNSGKTTKKHQSKTVSEIELEFSQENTNASAGVKENMRSCYGCGVSNIDNFLSGASDVFEYKRWPWIVSLTNPNTLKPSCGAVLIGPRWLLTTAECTKKVAAGSADYVQGGVLYLFDFPVQTADIDNIFSHPNYTDASGSAEHDIGLLELKTNLDIGTGQTETRPICLPDPDGPAYTDCYYAGWGITSENAEFDYYLWEDSIDRLLSDEECELATSQDWISTGGVICAESTSGGQPCRGDLGAPLMCKQGDDNYVIAGMATFHDNNNCDIPGKPIGFAQVDEHVEWIKDIMSRGD